MSWLPKNVLEDSEIRRRFLTTVFMLSALSLFLFFNNCSKSSGLVRLDSINLASAAVKKVEVNFCEPPPVAQKLNIKTVIVLDHSGSNTQNYKMKSDGSGEPDVSSGNVIISTSYATDPLGLLRYGTPTKTGTLLNYLSTLPANNPANPNRFFALVDFSDNAVPYPPGGTSFTSDIPAFYNYVYQKSGQANSTAPNDQGGTSYITALNQAYNIINSDLQNAKACEALPKTTPPTAACPQPGVSIASSYVVLFMSDGSPIIKLGLATSATGGIVQQPLTQADCPYPNQLINGVICKESTQSILGLVNSIFALSSDKQHVAGVNLFTVYYSVPGNIDLNSQTLLAQMAQAGNGIAYSATSGSSLNYNQFQPPQKQVQYAMSDIFVTNTSGVWWSDGKFYADSDGDGLPDFVETQWGSDPRNPRSQKNGISDLVRYRLANGGPSPLVNYASGLCSGVATSPDPLNSGGIIFKSSDPNGLNDCEKIILNDTAGINNPDSNQDSIPDQLELKNNIPFQSGSSPAVNSPQLDGYTLYNKIKYNLPTQTSVTSSPNLQPAQYNLIQTGSQGLQTCYRLTVTNLPIISDTDRIRVDVTFKTNMPNVSDQYRVGFKNFVSGSDTLIFKDWLDATEIANKTWSAWP